LSFIGPLSYGYCIVITTLIYQKFLSRIASELFVMSNYIFVQPCRVKNNRPHTSMYLIMNTNKIMFVRTTLVIYVTNYYVY